MLLFLGLFSGLVSVIMYVPYIWDTLRGKTHPERASWFIWSVLGCIAIGSQLAKGATDSIWMSVAQALGTLVVFLLAIRLGTGGFTRRDVLSLVLAALGLGLWFITREAAIALFITMGVDAIGATLTAVKAYEMPGSETLVTWVLSAISGVLGAAAVGDFRPILLAYPLYVTCVNCCVIAGILLGCWRKPHPLPAKA